MKQAMFLAAVLLGLALAGSAHAQGFGGIDPTKLIYTPVDTSNSVVPIAKPMLLPFIDRSLVSWFPTSHVATGQITPGYSNFPSRQQMPGLDYLKAFGYQRLGGK